MPYLADSKRWISIQFFPVHSLLDAGFQGADDPVCLLICPRGEQAPPEVQDITTAELMDVLVGDRVSENILVDEGALVLYMLLKDSVFFGSKSGHMRALVPFIKGIQVVPQ